MNSAVTRRSAVHTAGLGLAAFACIAGRSDAAELSAAERANLQLVSDFCAAWPSHDLDRIMSFFGENCSYRMTETMEPVKGRQAVTDRIKSFLGIVQGFEVIETFARGPIVMNERRDHFTGGGLKMWHGVGVFFVKDGKIAEWSDYTISMQRA